MKDYVNKYLSKKKWLIVEEGWESNLQNVRESQFTLGNGVLCSRGVLEEIPYDSYAGTYIAGIYDKTAAQVSELVNLPNPINFKMAVEGEKFGMVAMDILSHQRTLDMRKGILVRKTQYRSTKNRSFDYQSIRFISMHNKSIGVMRIYFTPQEAPTTINVETAIDTSITNRGVLTEGRKRHFNLYQIDQLKDIKFLSVQTFEKKHIIAYASHIEVSRGSYRYKVNQDSFQLSLKKGQTVCFTKIFSIKTFNNDINPHRIKGQTIDSLKKAVSLGFDKLLLQHTRSLRRKWVTCDIQIEGDLTLNKSLRFNIYHMLISADENTKMSVPARALSGEGYRGHIFWDADIFILPFFVYTNPAIARSLLLYRFNRLDAARKIAKERGFKGAMFPWESADTGFDETPSWAKNLDGNIIKIHTNTQEHHITADIAYAVYNYYLVTNDKDFLLKYGLEILFETARFWASRVEYNKKKDFYEIKNVIGPDEFHEGVDNNAYTNAMAKWNLSRAYKIYKQLRRNNTEDLKRIVDKIKLKKIEVFNWKCIAAKINILYDKERKIMESFQGYFRKKKIKITSFDEYFMPSFPKGIKLKEIAKTQLIKQADVVMLLHLLSDSFSFKTKKNNYIFYDKRTLHKSSLSPSIHACVGPGIGEVMRAYQYLTAAANIDLCDINGNTHSGIHAASLGGVWQAVIHGFAGICIKRGVLSINPRLPYYWKGLKFRLKYQGMDFFFEINRNNIQLLFRSIKKRYRLKLKIFGNMRKVMANRRNIFVKRKEVK